MKRNRVYLPKQPKIAFGAGVDALQRIMAILESSFDGIFVTD